MAGFLPMTYLKQLYKLKFDPKKNNNNNKGSLKVFSNIHTVTSLDILSAGFHMVSALHIGVR